MSLSFPLSFSSLFCVLLLSLIKTEWNYCVTDRELLAIQYFKEYYRVHLLHKQFLIQTDHQGLKWLLCMKDPQSRIIRWIDALTKYDFIIDHRSEGYHQNVDALSRCLNPWNCECKMFKNKMMESTMPDQAQTGPDTHRDSAVWNVHRTSSKTASTLSLCLSASPVWSRVD